MAEGFANHYGSDVLLATSAGLAPVLSIVPQTVEAMLAKNVDVSQHVPRPYDPRETSFTDIVVNMAGFKLPGPAPKELLEWKVEDPYGAPMKTYRAVRDDLEQRVMNLILDLRRRAKKSAL
jgi:protein-tyrosine-phosphatase